MGELPDERIKSVLMNARTTLVLTYAATWIEDHIQTNTRFRMLVPHLYGL